MKYRYSNINDYDVMTILCKYTISRYSIVCRYRCSDIDTIQDFNLPRNSSLNCALIAMGIVNDCFYYRSTYVNLVDTSRSYRVYMFLVLCTSLRTNSPVENR